MLIIDAALNYLKNVGDSKIFDGFKKIQSVTISSV